MFCVRTKLAFNAPKDGRGIGQKQVLEQNLSSTDVHGRTSVERYSGCTTVEDGSNGLTVSMILRFSSILSDAFTRLPKKMCKILFKILHRQATVAYNAESSLNILYFAILSKISYLLSKNAFTFSITAADHPPLHTNFPLSRKMR